MWNIRLGIAFASSELLGFDLHPAHRINLACRYNLGDWIASAVRQLLATPLQEYSAEDVDNLGIKIYVIIATTKEMISTERKRFGNFVPYPRDFSAGPYCAHHDTCKRIWNDKWFTTILCCIHSVTDPIPLSELPEVLEATDHRGIGLGCKEFIMAWFRNCHHMQVEETLITSAIDAVYNLCTA